MTLCAHEPTVRSISPDDWAASNFAANCDALGREQAWLQPHDCDSTLSLTVSWTVARDGSLSAKITTADGNRWIGDCSLPARASAAMLKSSTLTNPVTCFLVPFHAAAIRCNLDMLQPEQAVIAVIPSTSDLSILLHCEDFSADIAQHRLWFVAGEEWAAQLEQLLLQQIGLAVPSQFLRLNVAEESVVAQLIDQAQGVFARVAASRSQQIIAMQSESLTRSPRRLCVLTPMRFQLWNDEGFVLANAAPVDALRLNSSDPSQASPLKLSRCAIDAGMLLTANLARADMPNVVPSDIPWLSWITNDRVPDFNSAGPNDQLLVADPNVQRAARSCGWPAERLHAASWPVAADRAGTPDLRELTVLADTRSLETPDNLENFSSHRVLWETLRREIADDPMPVLKFGVADYLRRKLKQFDIAEDSFPMEQFARELVIPAYGHAIVDLMVARSIAVKLFGEGWNAIDRFAPFAAGSLPTRTALAQAIASAKSLLHVWPTTFVHPIESLGLPVVRVSNEQTRPGKSSGRDTIDVVLKRILNSL